MEKKFKCKDEILLKNKKDKSAIWFYAIFSNYCKNNTYITTSGGITYDLDIYNILPYEGNEELVGKTDEPGFPLSEKEIQDAYWNECTEKEKENLRKNYNILLKEDGRGKFILEKYCGKHNLQTDSPDEEVRLEEGGFIFAIQDINCNTEDWVFGKFIEITDDSKIGTDFISFNYAIRFKDFDPFNMEETRKHILAVKDGRIIRYKG